MKHYGLIAEFRSAGDLLAAARRAHEAGYRKIDAYSPFPIEGLVETLGRYQDRVPMLALIGGLLGGAGGYFMQWYAATISLPINVGGRPLHSWPSFIPITFELAVLGAALFAVFGMLALNRLPELYHPLFNVPEFELASRNRFFLCVRCEDRLYDRERTHKFLSSLDSIAVKEVEG